MLVKLRYKEPEGETSRLLTFPVANRTAALSENTGFAAAVAQFGMLLRQSPHSGGGSYASAAALARRHRGADDTGYRAEFVRLVELAEALAGRAGTRRDEPGRRAAVQ
jgi:Ca-activated chloride channel family protein